MLKVTCLLSLILFLTVSLGVSGQNLTHRAIPDSLIEYETNALYVQLSENYSWGSGEILNSQDERLTDFPLLRTLFEDEVILKIRQEFKVLAKKDAAVGRVYRIQLTENQTPDEVLAFLHGQAGFSFAEKIPLYRTFYIPNDPAFSDTQKSWHLNQIQASGAWAISQGCQSRTIAIVDDAVLTNHEDLATNIFLNTAEISNNGIDDDLNGYVDDVHGFDVADMDANANPPASASATFFTHGTLVAGAASAQTNNNLGIASIGFNTSIIPVKTKSDGELTPGLLTNPMQGVEYAIASGADVINMSWGSYASSQAHQLLFNNAYSAGIVTVGATGNQGLNFLMYPAAYEHVIAVAASDQSNDGATFSNVTTEVTVFAPGVQIWSCLADATNSYGYASGTSMAAPIVSGVAALMLCNDSTFTPEGIQNCIANSANTYPSTLYPGLTIRVLNAQAAVSCPIPFANQCEAEGCELLANGGFEEPSNSSITVYGNFGWGAVSEGQVCSWESYLGTVDVFPNPVATFDNYAGMYFSVSASPGWPPYMEGLVSKELNLIAGQSYTLEFDASMAGFDQNVPLDSLFIGLMSNSFYYDAMASPPDTFPTQQLAAIYNIQMDTLLTVFDQPDILNGTIDMSSFFHHYTVTFTMPPVTGMDRLILMPYEGALVTGYTNQLYVDNLSLKANLNVAASSDQDTILEGDCVNLSASGSGNSFVWEPDVLFPNPVGAVQVSCPDTSTVFIVTVFDPVTACTASDTVNVFVIPNPELGVPEQEKTMVTSYPNPVSSELYVKSENADGKLQFELVDAMGKILIHGVIDPNQPAMVQMKDFSAGVYTLKVSNGKRIQVVKR